MKMMNIIYNAINGDTYLFRWMGTPYNFKKGVPVKVPEDLFQILINKKGLFLNDIGVVETHKENKNVRKDGAQLRYFN